MQGLNEQELLLSLPELLNTLFVVADDHGSEHFVTLSLGADFKVVCSLLHFLLVQALRFNTKLVVELAAHFEGLHAVVCVTLDVLQQAVRSLLVREQHVFDHIESEDLLLKLLLVAQELLLLRRDLASQHGLSATLLLAGQLPVLKLLDSCFEGLALLGSLRGCLLMESALSINDEWEEVRGELVARGSVESVADVDETFPL